MKSTWIMAPILASLNIGVSSCTSEPEGSACPATGARLYVTSTGIVTLNGDVVDVNAVKEALANIDPPPTVACYSRDAAAGEPHPATSQVIDAIIAQQLPVAFYTDNTFKIAVKME
ncbi:MAG: hypothetical protein R3E77_05440 [Steroidobacteraceae bacterium]